MTSGCESTGTFLKLCMCQCLCVFVYFCEPDCLQIYRQIGISIHTPTQMPNSTNVYTLHMHYTSAHTYTFGSGKFISRFIKTAHFIIKFFDIVNDRHTHHFDAKINSILTVHRSPFTYPYNIHIHTYNYIIWHWLRQISTQFESTSN